MADRSFGQLTQPAYILQRRRSHIGNIGRWTVACAACLALGAAAAIGYTRLQQPCAPCTAVQQDDSVRLELARTRLALQQEWAARPPVQEPPEAPATEARRLSEELRFLRSQAQPLRR